MSDHDTWNMFAAHAAAGMCAYHGSYGLNNSPGDIADRARQIADALLAESKKRQKPAEPTPPQPDDDGWIKWEGGSCPVPHGTLVSLKFNDGWVVLATHADGWNWKHSSEEDATGNIVAYRIVSEAGVTK